MLIMSVCAFQSGAQTLTATYVALADSADRYIKNERWEDAERVIIKALRHEPANKSNYLLWSNLGTVRTNRGDNEGALEAFDIGLASAPRSTMLLSNRARTYLLLDRKREALADLDKALDLDSALQWPRKMRGLLLTAMGDTASARRDLEIYTERFGKDAAVIEAEGDLAVRSGDSAKGIGLYKESFSLEPYEDLAVKTLLTAYGFGMLGKEQDFLHTALTRYPREGRLYLIRALLDKELFQTDAMEHDIEIATELGIPLQEIERLLPRQQQQLPE